MAAIALAIYLAGLALAFGWRSVVQWRRTGDTGLRLDAGPAGTVRWWAKLLGTSWRVGVDLREHTSLITTGVFAVTRNPIFTAMTATSLGIALMAPNVMSVRVMKSSRG
jgi:protein-S-isoprenylcysteine O-methyltransferase Ste14